MNRRIGESANRRKGILIFILLFFCITPQTKAQEIKTAGDFSYKLQKYTGFNFLADFLGEKSIQGFIKLKTKADIIDVNLEIYSGWDLLRKKAKSLNIKANNLFVKDVPVSYFEFNTDGPVYFKKNRLRKNKVVFPLVISANLKLDLNNINEIFNNLPKWKKIFSEFDLLLPPFGETKISLGDLKIKINEHGLVQVTGTVSSVVNPQSEPLKMLFSGNLELSNKKLIINNIESEIEGIFTKDSDVARSFSDMLKDLINPIFDFHKFEKKGLTIDSINMLFGENSVVFEIKSRLLPEGG